jgi:hypothetical protein
VLVVVQNQDGCSGTGTAPAASGTHPSSDATAISEGLGNTVDAVDDISFIIIFVYAAAEPRTTGCLQVRRGRDSDRRGGPSRFA